MCVCFEFAEMNWYLINSFTLINLPLAHPPPSSSSSSSPSRALRKPQTSDPAPLANATLSSWQVLTVRTVMRHVDLMKLPYNCCSDLQSLSTPPPPAHTHQKEIKLKLTYHRQAAPADKGVQFLEKGIGFIRGFISPDSVPIPIPIPIPVPAAASAACCC